MSEYTFTKDFLTSETRLVLHCKKHVLQKQRLRTLYTLRDINCYYFEICYGGIINEKSRNIYAAVLPTYQMFTTTILWFG